MNFFRIHHTQSGTTTDAVTNWTELQIEAKWEAPYFTKGFSIPAAICSAAFVDAMEAEAGNDLCKEIELELQYSCDGKTWTTIQTGTVHIYDLEASCLECRTTIPINSIDYLQRVRRDQAKKLCQATDLELCVPQFQTGGEITDATGATVRKPFIKVTDLIKGFLTRYGGPGATTITGDLFTQPYQQEQWQFDLTGVTAGATMTLQLLTGLGTTYNITVTVPTGGDPATYLRNALLYEQYTGSAALQTGHSMPMLELVHRISNATASGTTVTTYTDYPITVIAATSTIGTITPTQLQAWQYGLRDLVISGEGMSDQVCLSWQDFVQFLQSIHPVVIEATSTGINISSEWDAFQTGTPGSVEVSEAETVTRRYRVDDIVGRIQAGVNFPISNYEDSQQGWQIFGTKIPMVPFKAPNEVPIYTHAGASVVVTAGGSITITNNDATARQVTVSLRASTSTSAFLPFAAGIGLLAIPAGGTATFTVGDTLGYDSDTFCLQAGDQILVSVRDIIGTDLTGSYNFASTSSGYYLSGQSAQEYGAPGMKESYLMFRGEPTAETGYPNCHGVFGSEQDDKYYTGLGYRHTQQALELADYSSTFFLGFQSASDPTCLEKFRRAFYFGTAPGFACWDDSQVDMWFHNMPLQPPILLYLLGRTFPGSYYQPAFTITTTYTGTAWNQSTSEVTTERAGDARQLYELEATTCVTMSQALTMMAEKRSNAPLCGRLDDRARVRELQYNISTGAITMVLLSE